MCSQERSLLLAADLKALIASRAASLNDAREVLRVLRTQCSYAIEEAATIQSSLALVVSQNRQFSIDSVVRQKFMEDLQRMKFELDEREGILQFQLDA